MSCAVCENLQPALLDHVVHGQRCTIFIWRTALQQSAVSGRCAECQLLFRAIVAAKGDEVMDWNAEDRSLRLTMAEGLPLEIIDGSQGLYLEIYCGYRNSTDLGLPATIGYGSSISKRSDSDESVALIRSWLNECESNHNFCKRSTPYSLPTRLLRLTDTVTTEVEVRLVDASHLQERYLALSYSWGCPIKHPQLKTTKDLLSRHKEDIDFQLLPRTLQDATLLTKRLGFEYLWVDALCIIQDDEQDWNVEAGRMSEVYMNAAVTLVASRSTGSSDPLFGEHSYSVTVELPYKERSVFVRERLARSHFNDAISTHDYAVDPLVTRAWALQEAMLSNRAVYFSSQELRWECNEASQCQCGVLTKGTHEKDEYDHRVFRVPKFFVFNDVQSAYDAWHIAVMSYSNRYLTYDQDRLVALSGLAQQFSKMMRITFGQEDSYLAGIWSGSLPKSLLWTIEHVKFSVKRGRRHERPSVWRAPSWSWASMEAPMLQKYVNDLQSRIAILDTYIEPLTPDPFGQLQSASLRIRGPLLANVSPIQGLVAYNLAGYAAFEYNGLPLRADVCLRDEEYIDLPPTLCILVVGYRASDVHEVLLLEAVEKASATYRRLGMATLGAHFREPLEHKKAILNAPIHEVTLI